MLISDIKPRNLVSHESYNDFANYTSEMDYSVEDLVDYIYGITDVYYWINLESVWGKIGFVWDVYNERGHFQSSQIPFNVIPVIPDGHRLKSLDNLLKAIRKDNLTLLKSDWSNVTSCDFIVTSANFGDTFILDLRGANFNAPYKEGYNCHTLVDGSTNVGIIVHGDFSNYGNFFLGINANLNFTKSDIKIPNFVLENFTNTQTNSGRTHIFIEEDMEDIDLTTKIGKILITADDRESVKYKQINPLYIKGSVTKYPYTYTSVFKHPINIKLVNITIDDSYKSKLDITDLGSIFSTNAGELVCNNVIVVGNGEDDIIIPALNTKYINHFKIEGDFKYLVRNFYTQVFNSDNNSFVNEYSDKVRYIPEYPDTYNYGAYCPSYGNITETGGFTYKAVTMTDYTIDCTNIRRLYPNYIKDVNIMRYVVYPLSYINENSGRSNNIYIHNPSLINTQNLERLSCRGGVYLNTDCSNLKRLSVYSYSYNNLIWDILYPVSLNLFDFDFLVQLSFASKSDFYYKNKTTEAVPIKIVPDEDNYMYCFLWTNVYNYKDTSTSLLAIEGTDEQKQANKLCSNVFDLHLCNTVSDNRYTPEFNFSVPVYIYNSNVKVTLANTEAAATFTDSIKGASTKKIIYIKQSSYSLLSQEQIESIINKNYEFNISL